MFFGYASKFTLALIFLLSLNGCVLVPFVQAFKETGLTEGDRMELLPPVVKRFSDARVFGNRAEALTLVASESKAEISKQLAPGPDKERIVKSQIEDIEWIDNARKAKVKIAVESFTMAQLVVKTVVEEQQWEFSPGSGWRLTARNKLEE